MLFHRPPRVDVTKLLTRRGLARLRTLTIHHGRHTFISHVLAGDRTLAEVRDAASHANVSITSAYLHIAVDDEGIGNLFGIH